MTDDLRQHIDAAIRPNMLLGLQDAELFDAPGAERISEWADWISKTVAELVQPQLDTAHQLISDFVDPDPCHYDHHGYCQAHGWFATEPACPHARAKTMLPEEQDEEQQ